MFVAGRILGGMKYLGQWEERCEAIIEELGQIEGVLCVENLLELVRQGGCDPSESTSRSERVESSPRKRRHSST